MSSLRIHFDKHGKVRFTSHRDVARIWERALRRAGVPVAYSEGFSPRPRLSFGLALPTGYSSDAEYLDVHLAPDAWADAWADGWPESGADTAALVPLLSECLPVGMGIVAVREIGSGLPSLQQAVTSCTWQIDVCAAGARDVADAVAAALESEELIVTRTRKSKQVTDDIRPLLISLEVVGAVTASGAGGERAVTSTQPGAGEAADEGAGEAAGTIAAGISVASGEFHGRNGACVRIIAELGTQPRAVRVPELLAALDPAVSEHHVLRTHQWILNHDGKRVDPMSVEAPSPAASGAT